jgi:gliding motility-associated-like protein
VKYFYSTYKEIRKFRWFAIATFFLLSNYDFGYAQVRVPFEIRTSSNAPLQKSYSINGDFSFIGNTNLTLVNYENNVNNNNNSMQYVDVDNDLSTWNSSSADLHFSDENGSIDSCTEILYAGLYWTGRSTPDGAANSPNEFSVTKNIDGTTLIKRFNKKKILFKGGNSSSYEEFIAEENAIYYPNASDAFIYSAYTEVTEYVRQHGMGTYFAADLALVEGNGSGTGYSGGWGLIVIYENSKMKHRDITLFDGHAFVLNSTSNGYNVSVDGFNTLRTGNVGVKLGIMASEGDVGLNGDYFQIQKNSDLSFMNLHHDLNSENNFFNSSNTNSSRNPALSNNTGIDIATFSLPNENNSVIGNNQTSTNFRYGTVGDTYAIFAIALAVDSYRPKVENFISVLSVNGISFNSNTKVLPGQEIDFNVAIKNLENESISNYKIVVPMPFNASFVNESAQGIIATNPSVSNTSNIFFDSTIGTYGALVWNYGTLPISENPETILANLRFKIKATEDCFILKNNVCDSTIYVEGFSVGTGTISNVTFDSCPFILGKNANGNCDGNIVKGPIKMVIDATDFIESSCSNDIIRNFTFCDGQSTLPLSEIASYFPAGCKFYSSFPVTENSINYSNSEGFPLVAGSTIHYFAVPVNLGTGCYFPFTLTKCTELIATNDIGTTINSSVGGIAYNNILANDTLNGIAVLPSQVQISLISPLVVGITLNNSNILVASGTAAGNYTLTYQICDLSDLSRCQQATVNFTVTNTQIVAENNDFEIECFSSGIIGNILNNDTMNGLTCQPNEVDISIISTTNENIQIDHSTGEILIDGDLSSGNYLLEYKIAVKGNPMLFDMATVSIHAVDRTPPAQPLLVDLVGYCSISAPIPNTTDSCSGSVTGYTEDSLEYSIPGEYTIHWRFTDESNNSSYVDQRILLRNSEDAVPGYGYVDCNLDNDASLNIDLNSFLPEGTNRAGNWSSSNSTPNLDGSVFSPYQAPTGHYDFQYLYNEGNCNQTANVTIEVNNDCYVAPACNLLVHNSFSPNNDGINEVFFIENIDQINCFPTNSVEIYNRWGVLVFKINQYDNLNRVFRGISEGRATLNESQQLPTGTYYYIIKYEDGNSNSKEQVGYVYLVM